MLTYDSSIDDDYLQNASSILDKLKSYYRQGGESSNLSKLLQDYTQVFYNVKLSFQAIIISIPLDLLKLFLPTYKTQIHPMYNHIKHMDIFLSVG